LVKKRLKKSDEEEATRKSLPRTVKTSPVKNQNSEINISTSKKHKIEIEEESSEEAPKKEN